MKRKYLDDLGVKDRHDLWCNDNEERQEKFCAQRSEYGFDERETWSLDSAFYMWLYERLMMFKEIAAEIVDLNFNKFIYKEVTLTQLQLIDMMLERLEFYFSDKFDEFNEDCQKYCHEIEQIWAIVLPTMWW